MKVLNPAVTVLSVSHMKSPWLPETIESVLAQERKDLELVIADSGQWIGRNDKASQQMAAIHAKYSGHPLVSWYTTGELPGLRQRRCPLSWSQNAAIRAGLVRGRYFTMFYDEDLYLPGFTAAMAGYLDANPDAPAVWCSQEQQREIGSGSFMTELFRPANITKVQGQLDCQVDGIQVMIRTSLLDLIGDPWMEEDPAPGSCGHVDGIFLERVAAVGGPIPFLPDRSVLCINRRTRLSVSRPVLDLM